jgi:hypothetical protein
MVEATKSCKERMREARAKARAKRDAEKAEWHRRAELRYEIRKLVMDAVKAGIRARRDKRPRSSRCRDGPNGLLSRRQSGARLRPPSGARESAVGRRRIMSGATVCFSVVGATRRRCVFATILTPSSARLFVQQTSLQTVDVRGYKARLNRRAVAWRCQPPRCRPFILSRHASSR